MPRTPVKIGVRVEVLTYASMVARGNCWTVAEARNESPLLGGQGKGAESAEVAVRENAARNRKLGLRLLARG